MRPEPLAYSRALASTATAGALRGTRCFIPAFMRSAGLVHVAESRSISSHRAPLTSPDLAAERLEGRRVLVYVTHAGTRDITGRMDDILTRHGSRVVVMKADAAVPDRREAWVTDRVDEGIDVIVCHPGWCRPDST